MEYTMSQPLKYSSQNDLAKVSGRESVAAFYRKALAREIARKIHTETFDMIFVSSAVMAEYVLEVSTLPRVIDFVD
jgi:hypothetical protein